MNLNVISVWYDKLRVKLKLWIKSQLMSQNKTFNQNDKLHVKLKF